MEITESQADKWLEEDLRDAINDVSHIPDAESLNRVRTEVIVEMAFNLGVVGALKFKNMWRAIRAQNFIEASKEMLDSKWARQVGIRADRLAERMKRG